MSVKPLLCSPSPRDIPEVYEEITKTEFDILWAKYFTEQNAYEVLRNFFLEKKQYTHLVICPDDLVVTQESLDLLIADLEKNDYPILAGVANVDLAQNLDKFCITENLPHPARYMKDKAGKIIRWGYRWYQWYEKSNMPFGIIRVPHSGFAAQFICRDVVEKIKFSDDIEYNEGVGKGASSGVDIMFSNACEWADIPITVDTRVQMLHMRPPGPVTLTFGDPEVRWRHDGKIDVFKPKSSFQKRQTKKVKDWAKDKLDRDDLNTKMTTP